jgi:hypothetical protein
MNGGFTGCGKTRFYVGIVPQRLKPGLIFAGLTVRLEAAPFQSMARI